jgi:transposase InsO family protein
MTMKAIKEVLLEFKHEYWTGTKKEKGQILDTVTKTTKLHRKAAIRAFARICTKRQRDTESRGRPTIYGPDVHAALFAVWEVGAHCCAELLHGEIIVYSDALIKLGQWPYDDLVTGLLRQMSLGEMKRRIGRLRTKHHLKGRSTTTPSTIKRKVRVYAGPWRQREPGHRQFDTVVHCGDRLQGDMVYTVNGTDTALMWSNQRAQWNKGEVATLASVEYIEKHIPSKTLSRHSDSGSEFLNFYFLDASARAEVNQTRSRSGKKNDNAFIEERNGNIVRKWIGYERYDTEEHVLALNDLYEVLDLYLNHFQAVRRCIKRERVGARYVRRYEKAKTPYARTLAHPLIAEVKKRELRAIHATLNPVTLLQEIAKLKSVLAKINKRLQP